MIRIELRDEDGPLHFDLPENANLLSLPMAPLARETILETGSWLVLAAAVWSGPDLQEIESLVQHMGDLPPSVHAAVRPFDDRREFETWVPGFDQRYQSPVWILLDDGSVSATWVGRRTADVVRETNETLGSPTPAGGA